MQQREILRIGCRLLGIYCLILAIPALARALWQPSLQGVWESLPPADAFLVRVAALVRPVLTAAVGAHLLLGGSLVQRLAFRNGAQPLPDDSEGLFVILMQLLGVYFVAMNLPDLVGILAGLAEKSRSSQLGQFTGTPQGATGWQTAFRLLPHAVELAFGCYLVAGGAIFRRLAFPTTLAPAEREAPQQPDQTL